jgi:hypothetical protein
MRRTDTVLQKLFERYGELCRPRIIALAAVVTAASAIGLVLALGCGADALMDKGGGGPGGSGLHSGPCSPEAATVSCHMQTGRDGNIVNCFNGTQTCIGGEWGPCTGASSGTLSTVVVPEKYQPSGGLSIKDVGAGDASGCVNDPCDPSYTGTCGSGLLPQWKQFAYDTSVPTQSDVLFTATTQPTLPDGGMGTATAPVQLADPGAVDSSDPAVCPMTGVTGCPVDLKAKLGVNSYNATINLTVLLTPVTAKPVLNSWSITYDCVPGE